MSTMTVTTKITHRYLMNKSKWDMAAFTMQIVDINDNLQKEIDRLRAELQAANEDADRLAAELELEQNPGYTSAALRLHRAQP